MKDTLLYNPMKKCQYVCFLPFSCTLYLKYVCFIFQYLYCICITFLNKYILNIYFMFLLQA